VAEGNQILFAKLNPARSSGRVHKYFGSIRVNALLSVGKKLDQTGQTSSLPISRFLVTT